MCTNSVQIIQNLTSKNIAFSLQQIFIIILSENKKVYIFTFLLSLWWQNRILRDFKSLGHIFFNAFVQESSSFFMFSIALTQLNYIDCAMTTSRQGMCTLKKQNNSCILRIKTILYFKVKRIKHLFALLPSFSRHLTLTKQI